MTTTETTERAPGADLWRLARGGRWRSVEWLRWVRGLRCCCGRPDCPNCSPRGGDYLETVVAAHWRYGASVGMGRKPDDFMTYPLAWSVHGRFHSQGQPPYEDQRRWVLGVWRRALQAGILVLRGYSLHSLQAWLAVPPTVPGETMVAVMRDAFVSGRLVLRHPFYTTIPF